MKELVCQQCGAPLVQKDSKHWYCAHCKLSYLADSDEAGYEFLYQPIEKKTIQTGQMAQKASSIQVQEITVKEIKVSDDIEVEVARDALQLSKEEAIKAVEFYLGKGDFEKASEEINRYLQQDNNCAEILFYSLLCEKKWQFINKGNGNISVKGDLTLFTEENKQLLERVLANSSPNFAKVVMNCLLFTEFSNDESSERILSACVPYIPNESVYTPKDQEEIFGKLFDRAINKSFSRSFDYLLNTLDKTQVDKYIEYNLRFANKASAEVARKYLSNVVNVDVGNLDVMRKLVETDLSIKALSKQEIITDFENLLKYSSNADKEVTDILSKLTARKVLTPLHSQLVRDLIGYHSEAPDGLKTELLAFANKLLKSSLFNEAIEYFYLILSFDKKCREAFLGLCLARIQAKDKDDVVNKKELIKDCREFSKCLALSDSAEQESLYGLAQEQEDRIKRKRKNTIKFATILSSIVAIILAIVIAVVSSNAAKQANYNKTYSLSNIEISITNKTAGTKNSSYYNGIVIDLHVDIKNKSTVDVVQIAGEMSVYKGESDLLMVWDVTNNSTITAGETAGRLWILDSSYCDEMVEFYNASLEELKITLQISYVRFSDNEVIENKDGTIEIIKPYNPQDIADKEQAELDALEARYQNALSLMQQGRYDEAYQEFSELGSYKDSAEKMQEAWNLEQSAIKELKYQTAINYMQQGQYKEAYKLFGEISDYKDSANKMSEIYDAQMDIARAYADSGDYSSAYSSMLEIGVTVDAWKYASQGDWQQAVNSGLSEVVISEGTVFIESGAFKGCNGLKKVTLPSSLEVIGEMAFLNCYGLTSITIPQNVYSIGDNAFGNCYKLVEVYDLSPYLDITKQSSYFGEVAYYAKEVFTNANESSHIFVDSNKYVFYESDTEAVLLDYIGTDVDLTLPALASGKQYAIQPYAFYENSVIRNIVIPSGVTEIGDYAFYSCPNIMDVTVGDDVVSIGISAFQSSGIESITMGSGLLTINNYAFEYCQYLASVTLGENLETIGKEAFNSCLDLLKITIPYSVKKIGSYAFCYAGLVYAKFENTEGWKSTYKSISPEALADPASAASILVADNNYGEWNRT